MRKTSTRYLLSPFSHYRMRKKISIADKNISSKSKFITKEYY
jgi:hypothetical protein